MLSQSCNKISQIKFLTRKDSVKRLSLPIISTKGISEQNGLTIIIYLLWSKLKKEKF